MTLHFGEWLSAGVESEYHDLLVIVINGHNCIIKSDRSIDLNKLDEHLSVLTGILSMRVQRGMALCESLCKFMADCLVRIVIQITHYLIRALSHCCLGYG